MTLQPTFGNGQIFVSDTSYLPAIKEIALWFEKTGFEQILQIDSFYPTNGKWVLKLGALDSTDKKLLANWENYKTGYFLVNQQRFEEEFMSTAAFLLNLGKDDLSILIYGHNPGLFRVSIGSTTGIVFIDESISTSMGGDEFKIPLDKNKIQSGYFKTKQTLDAADLTYIRRKIIQALNQYYGQIAQEARPWVNVGLYVDTIGLDYNEMEFKVTHIQKEILDEYPILGLWEIHLVGIRIHLKDNRVEISLNLTGKYSGGIFFPENEKKFKLISNYYPDATEKYLKGKLGKFILQQLEK